MQSRGKCCALPVSTFTSVGSGQVSTSLCSEPHLLNPFLFSAILLMSSVVSVRCVDFSMWSWSAKSACCCEVHTFPVQWSTEKKELGNLTIVVHSALSTWDLDCLVFDQPGVCYTADVVTLLGQTEVY